MPIENLYRWERRKANKVKGAKTANRTGSKAFDKSCRNHGSCSYCVDARTYQARKVREAAEQALREDYLGETEVSRRGKH